MQGNHLAAIINHLQDESLIPFTIPVLFNILVDYGETGDSSASFDGQEELTCHDLKNLHS